jgi:preprotein translocase subunit SecB
MSPAVEGRHHSGFSFDSVRVKEFTFKDNGDGLADVGKFADIQASIDVTFVVGSDDQWGVTTLRMKLLPPIERPDLFEVIAVTVEGKFSKATDSTTTVELKEFLGKHAAAILFPFVREAIASFMTKTRFGVILLPPLNVSAIVEEIEKTRAAVASES